MGVIKDGTVSGFLPSNEAFAVHYPGYSSSISRAVETLGGDQGIHKVRSLQSNRLELHFRREDPYSHPAYGDLRPCNNLLLKISKSKLTNGQSSGISDSLGLQGGNNLDNRTQIGEPKSRSVVSTKEAEVQTPEDDEANLSANIVARVLEAYHFDGMADYQHVVAVHADVARRKKRNWREVEEPHSEKDGLIGVDEEDVMTVVPPLFALKDIPENLVLRPSVILSSKRNQEEVVQPDCEIPKRINWEEYIPQDSDPWESQMAVSKLFDERPIWIKRSLNESLLDKGFNFVDSMLRRLLSRVAYYFSSGPFQRFWIRRGYDPRKDPDSRKYQRIDFRVHLSIRSYSDANSANQANQRWEDICAFRVFPFKCQTSLQLFELADDYIQQEIRKPPSQKTCTYATGWFSYAVLDSFRQRITIRFLSVYPKSGSEHLLKAATESFEKSKKRCNKDNVILHEEEQQPVDIEYNDTEVTRGEDVEEPNNVEYEEEEEDEEIEVENDEADDEISLQSQLYLNMESISRTHLQELFGSFPSTGGGDKVQNADISDEEYQILEQDSDGNFSDEYDY
ncbi:IIIC transcription factor [Parasponia andersonii]|uniref:IIIC transcription factor n=1 Tax=Parasponia andersonii TaxID=3476 RepID=A0A2P5DER9_PARAD|nr:IIIC transcription factor [Parasponia andersonii]